MSISINKNEIIHMDDYFRDRKRETFKPLIQNMAEDMLANGFKDVGPNITKITIFFSFLPFTFTQGRCL